MTMLNLEAEDAPLGKVVKVNELKESSMKGVFFAGIHLPLCRRAPSPLHEGLWQEGQHNRR